MRFHPGRTEFFHHEPPAGGAFEREGGIPLRN
jgi:hypothetical protein